MASGGGTGEEERKLTLLLGEELTVLCHTKQTAAKYTCMDWEFGLKDESRLTRAIGVGSLEFFAA